MKHAETENVLQWNSGTQWYLVVCHTVENVTNST